MTGRMLRGRRFIRILPRIYRHRDHVMTDDDWVLAARLALPSRAHLTGITRIQQLGLDFGPRFPVRFVVEGDLHLAFDEIFLHRTKRLPPTDGEGVIPAAAFISFCGRARVIDAIKVGDWLLYHGHMTVGELHDLALAEQWRDGADQALWVLDHLDGDARSLPESETRAIVEFAGLPVPEVNRRLPIEDSIVIGDLVLLEWRVVVEYEGSHHQADRGQYVSDISRYAVMRRHDFGYVQVTKEKLARARSVAREVHRELVSRGYDGPPPEFGDRWRTLFTRLHRVIGCERLGRRAGGEDGTAS
ncbi:hypothetical protein [Nocardioides sp.]|uniref:hypothetical protein n=1 Tax=Nocardioides sp. TaxID=35761 RepID=UPI002ED2B432